MAYVPKYPPPRQAAVPSAILMLRGFKTYAAMAQNFLDIANEAVKYAYYNATPAIHALQDYLGISAGWINAMDYDCLVDGVLLKTCRFDAASGAVIINGKPVVDPAIAWATVDGNPPPPYKPLRHVEGSGADLLTAFLHAGTQSAYLKSLGLTDEAIAAARA